MDEKLIAQIICDQEVGTAFYVTSDLLLTAYHTVSSFKEDGNNIIKDNLDGDLHFDVIDNFIDIDLSIVKVNGRTSKDYCRLQAHHNRINEEFSVLGYPEKLNNRSLRFRGIITQKKFASIADYIIQTKDVDSSYDYQGMSGAPVMANDEVVGVVIEQEGNQLCFISIEKANDKLSSLEIDHDVRINTIPASIAKDIEIAQPNYNVFKSLESALASDDPDWILLYGSPGCGKTTIIAGFEPELENETLQTLGRFFFKVPNDDMIRAIRCSESFFVDWIESVYLTESGADIEKLTLEEKKKNISGWFQNMSQDLESKGRYGILFIDGLDELKSDEVNHIDDFLSLLPENLPANITVVLSCISEDILPANILGRLSEDKKIKVTPLNMAACESYIYENSGKWEKNYSFIQAVANKTEGHPLYMNYLCNYIAKSFDEKTEETELNEWVENLPSISGDIRNYYESIWKRTNPNGYVCEVLALLSQIRGSVSESQLIDMTMHPNPYIFKSSISEFRHLLKEKEFNAYEIYHSSFRLFITDKLSSIISFTNDQIAKYCQKNPGLSYSKENILHHVVRGSAAIKGLEMCNQEWADNCALHDVSPDLVMHDIKECLSIAVDLGLSAEVIRIMLLAQRIENRCDSIMVDNVSVFVDLNLLYSKPEVALKYIVRDNVLLVDLPAAMAYLRLMLEYGYKEQAANLANSIDSTIRKTLVDNSEKGVDLSIFVIKGMLIVEGVLAGLEDPHDIPLYLTRISEQLGLETSEHRQQIILMRNMIISYQLSLQLRSGQQIDVQVYLDKFHIEWDVELVMLLVSVMSFYQEFESSLHKIGYNKAFENCLMQVEDAILHHDFSFSKEKLEVMLPVLIDKQIQSGVIKKLLASYNPTPGELMLRDDNGVDINLKSLLYFYQESLYKAYCDETLNTPFLNNECGLGGEWEKYVEALISRTAYLNGILYRKRSAGDDWSFLYSLLKEVLDSISFSFENRTTWKRSYLLPEELFPFLYEKLAEIYRDFFSGEIDDFMIHLTSRIPQQLSLYREGFCAILIRLVSVFRQTDKTHTQAIFLADEAVKYILYAVENRNERCSYLLQICREYTLLNEVSKAKSTYRDVLNSSMGPDWYKEAQLGLINQFRKTDLIFNADQIIHMSAVFEEASGEMTFQRYVQQEKNEFLATIAKTSSLEDAIAYYKFETFPCPERIICNAEDWKVDMPKLGNGYDLGANHLIEGSAMCQLLRECYSISPFIRYALSELFWNNWDKIHNDHQYAELHSEIIMGLGDKKAIEILAPRMAKYIVLDYDKKGGTYLNDIEKTTISGSFMDSLNQNLNLLGFEWKLTKRGEENGKMKPSLEIKLDSLPTSKAVLDDMRKEIVSPLGNYWYSLSEFITPLVNKSDFDKSKLFDIISEHYDINVQPTQQQFQKFSWMKGNHDENNKDEQMIEFLIWFLVHPDDVVSLRAESALKWLAQYDSRVVSCLIKEIQDNCETGLNVAASSVLLEITREIPYVVLELIKSEDVQKSLLGIHNFSVSRNFYVIASVLADKCDFAGFLIKMRELIPDKMLDRGEVMLDWGDMVLVEDKIDDLNALHVTGRNEFAKPYLQFLHSLRKDGTINLLFKSDEYTRRSFYISRPHKGRYMRVMQDVLNQVLYGKIDTIRADQVYFIINK